MVTSDKRRARFGVESDTRTHLGAYGQWYWQLSTPRYTVVSRSEPVLPYAMSIGIISELAKLTCAVGNDAITCHRYFSSSGPPSFSSSKSFLLGPPYIVLDAFS